jgi:sugar/nucleoside kinase (ribokinase family)
MNKLYDILSMGSVYLDITALQFPFVTELKAETETVGRDYEVTIGGSALNFSKMCAVLGMKPVFIGKVGNDRPGQIIHELMKETGIESGLITGDNVSTNLGLNFVNSVGKMLLTVVGTANQALSPDDIITKIDLYTDNVNYLYIGGFLKLKQLIPFYPEILQKMKEHGVRIVLDQGRIPNDISEHDLDALRNILSYVDIYLPSEDEFCSLWGEVDLNRGLQKVRQVTQATVVIKCGEKGATGMVTSEIIHVPGFTVQVHNTVGAGDSFNAGFIRAQQDGKSFVDCLRFANATAALKISKKILPTLNEIELLYDDGKLDQFA